jgi:threonine synthase
MQLYSTNNPNLRVDLKTAIFKGLPDDNGLFMPLVIPQLPDAFFQHITEWSFQDLSFQVAQTLLQGAIPEKDLKQIIDQAIDFPAPLITLDNHRYILELFHGPSLAFKDFGARFMAQTMSYFNSDKEKELVILVATSGDTGGAVAAGFYKTPGIKVVILYPSGKVSDLQELQLTTLGHNIQAIEIEGTFDDCQALVKQSFLDQELCKQIRLSSANSINIARLIPQSFYYFEAYKQLKALGNTAPVVFSIPSGNFGNLSAGLFAKRMGLPITQFIAATNTNDIVPDYLATGQYQPRLSIRTLSNAMDVGNPSNFSRMMDLYGSTWNMIKEDITGYAFSDHETELAIQTVYHKYNYTLDPHGAIGYLALEAYLKNHPDHSGIILETAHPAKFIDDVEKILQHPIEIPEKLKRLKGQQKKSTILQPVYSDFKSWLQSQY